MRFLVHIVLAGTAALLAGSSLRAQAPTARLVAVVEANPNEQSTAIALPQQDEKANKQIELLLRQIESQQRVIELLAESVKRQPVAATPLDKQPMPATAGTAAVPAGASLRPEAPNAKLVGLVEANPNGPRSTAKDKEIFQAHMVEATALAQQDEKTKKQVELLQKQIESQQKMIEILADHVKKQPLAGTPVDKLQTQAATLETRSRQGAERDQDLSQSIDNLSAHMDAVERNGPRLPATLKELFLPSQPNESPLSVYTNLVVGYNAPETGIAGPFFGNFSPHFRLILNDWIYAIGEIDVFFEWER
jgi:hypothetical protein